MDALLGVDPGHGVSQAAQAVAQGLAHGVAIHHPLRIAPGLGLAIEQAHGDAHVGCAFALAGKPKCGNGVRALFWQRQQVTGMG